jgi:hypothetical protein
MRHVLSSYQPPEVGEAMSRTISTVLPIQRAMASATPSSWRDALVVHAGTTDVQVAFLDGSIARLRVVGPTVELGAGDPVAYHPVAEILDARGIATTARLA